MTSPCWTVLTALPSFCETDLDDMVIPFIREGPRARSPNRSSSRRRALVLPTDTNANPEGTSRWPPEWPRKALSVLRGHPRGHPERAPREEARGFGSFHAWSRPRPTRREGCPRRLGGRRERSRRALERRGVVTSAVATGARAFATAAGAFAIHPHSIATASQAIRTAVLEHCDAIGANRDVLGRRGDGVVVRTDGRHDRRLRSRDGRCGRLGRPFAPRTAGVCATRVFGAYSKFSSTSDHAALPRRLRALTPSQPA